MGRRALAIAQAVSKAIADIWSAPFPNMFVEPLERRRLCAFVPGCGSGGSPFFDIVDPHADQSKDPVIYFDGAPVIDSTDLNSNGFGMPWGQTRTFNDANGPQATGNNWSVAQLPFFQVQTNQPQVGVPAGPTIRHVDNYPGGVGGGGNSGTSGSDTFASSSSGPMRLDFNLSAPTPQPWVPRQTSVLVGHPGDSTIKVIAEDGTVTIFVKGTTNSNRSTYYLFDSQTEPDGQITSVYGSRTSAQEPVDVRRTDGTTVEQWHYDYFGTGSGSLAGMLQDVQLQRSSNGGSTFTVVRQAVYDYYTDPSTQPGNLKDLKSVTIEDGSNAALDHTVYRYYTNNTNGGAVDFQSGTGYSGGPKFIFYGDSYARALADGYDPATMSDANAAKYSDMYFEYDSYHRVTLHTVHRFGSSSSTSDDRGSFHYAYSVNPSTNAAESPNGWTNETTETLPDGSKNYLFMNVIGQTLLNIHTDAAGDNQQSTFSNYDDYGRLSLEAEPSAVILPPSGPTIAANYDDLLHKVSGDYQYLSNHEGLVKAYAYYNSNTAGPTTPGGAASKLQTWSLLHGEKGTGIEQESITYFSRASAGSSITVYPKASDTVYSDTAALVPQTTTYVNTYHNSSTLVPGTVTTTFPTIAVSHNGQGTSGTITQVDSYDVYGQNVQTQDGDGYLRKTAYDLATGVPTTVEQDAGGGGRDLTTTYLVDGLGRPKRMTDPKGNVTYYTYDDINQESRIYPGWHAAGTNYATTGPVQISTHFLPTGTGQAVYDEVLTATMATQASPSPTGHDAITSVQTLHRDITNIAGQLTESRDYFAFSGTSYLAVDPGTASNDSSTGTYHLTRYHYDVNGYRDGVKSPTGTIERLVYDSAHRLTSIWSGTDDGTLDGNGNLGDFYPASPGTAIDIVDYAYDVYTSPLATPASAPSLSQTSGTVGATTYYVMVTYVGAHGESLASSESNKVITGATGLLVVAHPAPITGATGYNVYVATSTNNEEKQNGDTPISLSNDWTESASGLAIGPPPPLGLSGIGDNNTSRLTEHPLPGTSSADRTTDNYYDWRDRLVAVKQGTQTSENDGTHRPLYYGVYDNLDNLLEVNQYDGDNQTVTSTDGVPDAPTASTRRSRITASYDEWNRVYRVDRYDVTQSGTNAGALATNTLFTTLYYNNRSEITAQFDPGGLVSKYSYDGTGRIIKQYQSDGGALNISGTYRNYSNAASVSNDIVMQQTDYAYDDDGNMTSTTVRQRFHNAATNGAGALGELQDPSNNPKARVSYQHFWYDAANRLTDTADVGTNGTNGVYAPIGNPPSSSTDILLLTHVDYNDAGWANSVTDPKGNQIRTVFDMLGRGTRTIAASDGSDNPTVGSSTNIVTDYTYDGDNHVLTQTAWNKGTGSATFQTTQYVYGVTQADGNGIDSNDLLQTIRYPDKLTGSPGSGATNSTVFQYNAVGEMTEMKDRQGNVHVYGYDVLGRKISDTATTLGSGVDNQIRRIDTSFDSAGNIFLTTSYHGTTTATVVVNQIEDVYNGLGQLITEYQEHSGEVSDGGMFISAHVDYGYSEMAGGANHSRLTSIKYPNGRVITRDYDGNDGIDNTISRPTSVSDNGTNGAFHTVLEKYSYLGLDTIVEQTRPDNGTKLSYVQQPGDTVHGSDGGDQYTGLDRFGRVVDQWWLNYSGTSVTATVDRFQYGYDRNGNTLYKDNKVNSSFSELYHATGAGNGYDALNRLTGFVRGSLSQSGGGSAFDTVTSPNTNAAGVAGSQDWSLDSQGNWSAVTTDGIVQTRTSDEQNELTKLRTSTATNVISYDLNGNVTNDDHGNSISYDAWNRVREIDNGGILEKLVYDGAHHNAVSATFGPTKIYDYYFSMDWQIIEQDAPLLGVTVQQEVWSGGWNSYIDDMIERDRYLDTSGGAINERLYAEHDASHDVTSISANDGTVKERFVYDTYGKFSTLDVSWSTPLASNVAAVDWNYYHQGGRYDSTSQLYVFRLRNYSPSLGRWIEQDPAGYASGSSLYQYASSNAIRFRDPTGLVPGDVRSQIEEWYVNEGILHPVGGQAELVDRGVEAGEFADSYIEMRLNAARAELQAAKMANDLEAMNRASQAIGKLHNVRTALNVKANMDKNGALTPKAKPKPAPVCPTCPCGKPGCGCGSSSMVPPIPGLPDSVNDAIRGAQKATSGLGNVGMAAGTLVVAKATPVVVHLLNTQTKILKAIVPDKVWDWLTK